MRFRFFFLIHANFPTKKLYAAKQYIHVTQEGTEEILFVLSKAPVPAAGAGDIGALAVGINDHTDGAKANDAQNLLSGRTSNLCSEEMEELCRQGIAINDDNNLSPENAPRQGETTTGTGN